MKSIYIGLMIGMLCLLSNTTFAQIYQYSDDGSKAFIDPETGTGSRICFCNFVFQLNDFSQSLAASNDQYQWLLEQEELLKFDIEKRFNRTGNPYPNFTKAQFAFFNSFTPIANAGLDYRQRIQQNVEANINIDAASNQRYRTSKIKAETLSQWVRELASGGNRTHYFGDLKYEGQRIEDITDGLYLSREITQHTNAFNEELDKRRQLANVEDKLREAEARQIAEAVISDRFIGIYRNLPFKEAMEFMTEHMARDFEEVHPPMIDTYQFIIDNFGPDYENPLDKDYYNQIYNDIMDLSVGNPTTVTPYEVTPAEAIFEYALNEHLTPLGRSFLGENHAVKDEVMSFSQNNQYSQASLTNMSNLISANVEGRPALIHNDNFEHYTNYPPTDPIWDLLNNNTQSASFKNLMKTWHRPSFSVQNNGIIGYFNLVQDMQDAGVLHPRTEGHVIRASISHSYPDGVWNNLTNEELAQIFRVTSSSQTSSDSHWISILYDHNIGEIMFDNGYPNIEFLNSEFALGAALALAQGEGNDGIGTELNDPFVIKNMTPQQKESFKNAVNRMKETCLGQALLNLVNTVNVSVGQLSPGAVAQYNALTNTIEFSADAVGNALGEELFHAYQQQLYGTLVDIANSSSGHVGGSNIEFEEKAYTILLGWIEYNIKYEDWENNPEGLFMEFPPNVFPGTEPLNEWVQALIENHPPQSGHVSLSSDELNSWFAGVESFREYWFARIGCGSTAGNVYGCPTDISIKPDALINLFNKARENCN